MSTAAATDAAPAASPRDHRVSARLALVVALASALSMVWVAVTSLTGWGSELDQGSVGEVLASVVVFVALLGPFAALAAGFLGRASSRRSEAVAAAVVSVVVLLAAGVVFVSTPHYRWLGTVAWSPDSTRVVVTGDHGMWVASADGSSAPVRLRDTPTSAPAWSPDGTRIAFADTDGNILLLAQDGSAAVKLLSSPTSVNDVGGGIAWSPDGTRLAFASAGGDAMQSGVWIVGTDGTGLTRVTNVGDAPRWSPDGTKLAYVTQPNMPVEGLGIELPAGYDLTRWGYWMVDADGSHNTLLFQQDAATTDVLTWPAGHDRPVLVAGEPQVSPDGSRAVKVEGMGQFGRLVFSNPDGSDPITVRPVF